VLLSLGFAPVVSAAELSKPIKTIENPVDHELIAQIDRPSFFFDA
jgi:hypothetical protein